MNACLSLRLQVDVKDPRFQAMFTSPLFNLDPTHPAYRNTRATQSILSEKQHRRQPEGRGQQPEGRGQRGTTEARMDPSLSLLVKSIKNKTQEFQNRKKQKRSKV